MDPEKKIMTPLLLFLLFLNILLCLRTHTIAATTTTITYNNFIQDGDFLVSESQKFALGFFSPNSGSSNRRYVGIWLYNDSQRVILWVANRNSPLNDTSGVLSLNSAGNLIVSSSITATTEQPIWSTNASMANGGWVVVAKLLDSGNLVIVEERDSEKFIWQSFDHPTNTYFPLMKLGLDRITAMNRVLTSWRSADDPGTGTYSIRMDTTRPCPQLITYYNGSETIWRSGQWNGLRWSGIPEMDSSFLPHIVYVDNSSETTITYGALADGPVDFWRFTLDETGTATSFTWREDQPTWFKFWSAPKDFCDPYGQCGAFSYCDPNKRSEEYECKCLPGFKPRNPMQWSRRDRSSGCIREHILSSVCGQEEGFITMSHVKLPDTRVACAYTNLSGKECEDACLKNCTCVAYASRNVSSGSGCLTWHGDLMDIKLYTTEGEDLHIRVNKTELANFMRRSKGLKGAKRILVIVTVSILSVALLLIFVRHCWCKRHSRFRALWMCFFTRRTRVKGNGSTRTKKNIDLPFFSLREIKTATNYFCNKLGEGGFGPVYKGRLASGQEVAVKRLSENSCQGAEEFENEVMLISKLQHVNLVKVLGFCVDKEEVMLIYEYMPNKSLDSFIFDESRKHLLNWSRRSDIIVGIARGILYLHRDSRLRIIHRDLKTSNILLDGEMNPKISDFGLARIFGGNQTQQNTKRIVGTLGYMSPEYALDGLFSIKSDVFSFGVILLEIVSGKKNHALYNDDPFSNLIRYIWDLWRRGEIQEIVDVFMGDSCQDSEVLRYVQVGLLCVQEHAEDRPTMSSVVFMLCNEVALPTPKRPAYAVKRLERETASSSTSGSTSCSKNEVTMTLVEAR